MDIFSNREFATAFWVLALFAWATKKPDIRNSIKNLISAFKSKYIIFPIILMLIYVSVMVTVLYELGIWDVTHLKNTILWAVFVASVTLFRGQQGIDDPNYFITALKDNFKIIAVFEFIVTFYSFHILAELVIVPVTTMLVMMQAYTENKKEYAPALKLSETLLFIIAVFFIIHAYQSITNDITQFANFDSLKEFSLPIIMSIIFLPFMYIVITYLAYERVLLRLKNVLNDELAEYGKRLAIINFRTNRILLLRWFNLLYRIDIKSKKDLTNSISKVRGMRAAEKRCDHVDFKDGWSPYIAKRYLSELGIATKYYEPAYDELWSSSSDSLALEDENPILCNNIRYRIEGNEYHAKNLSIILDVNKPSEADDAHHMFLEACKILTDKALNIQLPKALCESIIVGTNIIQSLNFRKVSIERHDWVGNWKDCYELKFNISFSEN